MAETPTACTKIDYATLLEYSPRGRSLCSAYSREVVRNSVKNVREELLEESALLLKAGFSPELDSFFGKEVILVPVPRSMPHREDVPWPALEICRAIEKVGLVDSIWPGLRRVKSIRRSCHAALGERPDPEEHSRTLSVLGTIPAPIMFLLVDDFVTRGSTFIACAEVLRIAFPEAEVKGFGLVNTQSLGREVNRVVNPRIGMIEYHAGKLERECWTERVMSGRNCELNFPANFGGR